MFSKATQSILRPLPFILTALLLLAGSVMPLAAQDGGDGNGENGGNGGQIQKYRRQFRQFGLDGEQALLENLAERENSGEYVEVFFDAIKWMESRRRVGDLRIKEMARKAMKVIKNQEKSEAAPALWQLYRIEEETYFRIAVLDTLGAIVTEEQDGVIRRMNSWLAAQNSIYRDRSRVDRQVFFYALRALQQIGVPESYPLFLEAYSLQITKDLQRTALRACRSYGEEQKDLLIRMIQEEEPRMMYQATVFGIEKAGLDDQAKTEIAVQAVRTALDSRANSLLGRKQLRELRYAAAALLRNQGYTADSGLVIEHFDRTLEEYNRGICRRDYLLDAITCLGNAGDTPAAERLTEYMKNLNLDKVKGDRVDRQIVIAVLENIIKIGDMVSFDLMNQMEIQDNYAGEVDDLIQKAMDTILE